MVQLGNDTGGYMTEEDKIHVAAELFTQDSMGLGTRVLDDMEGSWETLEQAMDKGADLRDLAGKAAGQLDMEARFNTNDVFLITAWKAFRQVLARTVDLARDYGKEEQ